MKLLIVEDEHKVVDYLRSGLTEQGWVVDIALDGEEGMHLATEFGHEVVVRLLIENGAKATAKDANGWTPLHIAAGIGREAEVEDRAEVGRIDVVDDKHARAAALVTGEQVVREWIEGGLQSDVAQRTAADAQHNAASRKGEYLVSAGIGGIGDRDRRIHDSSTGAVRCPANLDLRGVSASRTAQAHRV